MQKIITGYLIYFFLALFLSLLATPLMRLLGFRFNVLDRGEKGSRKTHSGDIPRLGGVAIFVAFVLPYFLALLRNEWSDYHRQVCVILAASLLVFLIGLYDDIKGASITSRLGIESLAACLVFAGGIRIDGITNPAGGVLYLGWLSLPVTILWILVITNAINLIDGLDGLAAGTGILVSLIMLLLNIGENQNYIFVPLFALLGALLGFLVYNFPPASIFMGDAGSLFLGFFLGCFSILAGFKATSAAAIMIPFMAFSVPLLDMGYSILRRWHRGVPWGTADGEHIHHKLLDRGLGRKKVALAFYGVYFVILIVVMAFIQSKTRLGYLLLVLIFLIAVIGLRVLGYIRYSDFFWDNYRQFHITRRRRYFCYLIKRFQLKVAKKTSWADFHMHLHELILAYDFAGVEIKLKIGAALKTVYHYGTSEGEQNMLRLEFPLLKDGVSLGTAVFLKKMSDELFLCVSEMSRALSEAFGNFIPSYPDPSLIDWDAGQKDSRECQDPMTVSPNQKLPVN